MLSLILSLHTMYPSKSIPIPVKKYPPSARPYTIATYNAPKKVSPPPVKKYPPSARSYTIPTYNGPIKKYPQPN